MPGYLLDTSALSILAPKHGTAARPHFTVFRHWVRDHAEELFLSAITLAEIQSGISKLERKGARRRAAALCHWRDAILDLYESRTLPVASAAALETGRLLDRANAAGADPGFEDAAIAATAAVHGLTVVTDNGRHFEHFRVPFISPRMGNDDRGQYVRP